MADFRKDLARSMVALNRQIEPILEDVGLKQAAERIERKGQPRSTLRAYQQAFHTVLIAEGDDGAAWEGASRNAVCEAVGERLDKRPGTVRQYLRRNADRFGPGDDPPTLGELIEAARHWA
jgi:hypothetical protein